jgi:Leucine-rich repeat (LRR) protein
MEHQRRVVIIGTSIAGLLLLALLGGAGWRLYKTGSWKSPLTLQPIPKSKNIPSTANKYVLPKCDKGTIFADLNPQLKDFSKVCALEPRANALKQFAGKEKDFSNVKILMLQNDKLDQLPFDVSQMTTLEVLDLTNNKLTKLPDSIANLKDLHLLRISKNKFSDEEKVRIRYLVPDAIIEF